MSNAMRVPSIGFLEIAIGKTMFSSKTNVHRLRLTENKTFLTFQSNLLHREEILHFELHLYQEPKYV
jgi:hypothetical protein